MIFLRFSSLSFVLDFGPAKCLIIMRRAAVDTRKCNWKSSRHTLIWFESRVTICCGIALNLERLERLLKSRGSCENSLFNRDYKTLNLKILLQFFSRISSKSFSQTLIAVARIVANFLPFANRSTMFFVLSIPKTQLGSLSQQPHTKSGMKWRRRNEEWFKVRFDGNAIHW